MAPYALSASLDALQYSVHGSPLQLTKYELLDENSDPPNSSGVCTDHEQHFGYFNFDGSPKPVATAWHNLAAEINDPHPTYTQITPASFSVSGGVNNQLLTKSTGFDVLLWSDASFMNISTHANVTPSTQTVTVVLDKVYPTVSVYDPTATTPLIATYTNVYQVTVPLVGILVVDVNNGVTPTPPVVVVTPPPVTPTPPITVTGPTPVTTAPVVTPPVTIPPVTYSAHLIKVIVSGDSIDDRPEAAFTLSQGGIIAVSRSNVSIKTIQRTLPHMVTLTGTWPSGTYNLRVDFINEDCGCSNLSSRNLAVQAVIVDGKPLVGGFVPPEHGQPVNIPLNLY